MSKLDLLAHHLHTWAESALRRSRRVTYVHGYADDDGGAGAETAARVLSELPDLARGRELSMVAVGRDMDEVGKRLTAVRAGFPVLPIGGGTDERLAVALKAAGASNVPLLAYLDASAASEPPAATTIRAITGGKPAEVLLVLPPGGVYQGPGFPLVSSAALANGEVVVFATTSAKSLESFKDALWAAEPDRPVEEGELRRALLGHLAAEGPSTVTELRTFALTWTDYRSADVTPVLYDLIDTGEVARKPAEGRLGGDVVISL
ncbi:hypothetical protein [Actinoplanes couchii]|uniref:Uncharacterized protein n=1 Tax=Actinoplanes couchii TaxID=403638 RepID=A0ABQ3X530_9ACTN|nr:hypothetical protein [Actinoplanes couchii]MDR6326056.1 hypothetical protein [Actinoplanes couchii]GID53591.1 hypothetical protein Aco03nite_019950 [Actinoplanes couchii]